MYFTPVNMGSADRLQMTCDLSGGSSAVTLQHSGKETQDVPVEDKGNNDRQEIEGKKVSNDKTLTVSSAHASLEKVLTEGNELVAVNKRGRSMKCHTKSVSARAEGDNKDEGAVERQTEVTGQREDIVQKKSDFLLHIGGKAIVIKEARVLLSDILKNFSGEMISHVQDGKAPSSIPRSVSRRAQNKKESEYIKRLRSLVAGNERKDLNAGSDPGKKKSETVTQKVTHNNAQNQHIQGGAQMVKKRGSEAVPSSSESLSPVKGGLDHNSQSSIPLKKRVFRESLENDPDQDMPVTAAEPQSASKHVDTTLDSRLLSPKANLISVDSEDQTLSLDSPETEGAFKHAPARSSKTLAQKKLHSRKSRIVRAGLAQENTRILRDRNRPGNLQEEEKLAFTTSKMTPVNKCIVDTVNKTPQRKCEQELNDCSEEVEQQQVSHEMGENAAAGNELSAEESSISTEDEQSSNLKIRLKRKRGTEWEMESGLHRGDSAAEMGGPDPCGEELDPFKAILDSVAILNLEMERIRGHGEADKSVGLEQATKAVHDVLEHCRKESTAKPRKRRKKRLPVSSINREKRIGGPPKYAPGKSEVCRVFERPNLLLKDIKKETDVADVKPLPLIKLCRRAEGRWEVQGMQGSEAQKQDGHKGPGNSVLSEPRLLTCVPPERSALGDMPVSKVKQESLSPCQHQALATFSKDALNSEPLPLSLSLSPLSLNSPYAEGLMEATCLASSFGRGQETNVLENAERAERSRTGGVIRTESKDTSEVGLSHNLSQINKSLSKLQAMSQQPPLERSIPAYTSESTSCQVQSKPLSPPTSPFTTECNFSNYPEDILDFPCLNLEGYDQTQAQSSLTDYCSGEPHNTGSFSSPFSQSPADGWNAETPYLGSSSPGSSFSTAEDLSFPDLGLTRDETPSINSGPYFSSKDKTFCSTASSAAVKDSERNPFYPDVVSSKRNVILPTKEDPTTPLCLTDKTLGNQRDLIMFGTSSKQMVPPLTRSLSQDKQLLLDSSRTLSAQSDFSKMQTKDKSNGPHNFLSSANKLQPLTLGQSMQSLYNAGSQGNLVKPFHSVHTGSKATSCSELPGHLNLGSALLRAYEKKPVLFPNPNSSVKSEGGHGQNVCKNSLLGDTKFSSKPQNNKAELSDSSPGPSGSQSHKDVPTGCAESVHTRYSENARRDAKTVTPNKGPPKLQPPTDRVYPVYFFSSSKHLASAVRTAPIEKPQNLRIDTNSNGPATFFSSASTPNHSVPHIKNTRQDKPHAVVAPSQSSQLSLPLDRNPLCFSHCDPLDMNFSSSLSQAVSQHGSSQVGYRAPEAQDVPATKVQPSSFVCGQSAHPSYVVNFTGDHSVTLDYSEDGECLNYSSSVPTNYTYHCLMEPSGTQGRLILEPCAPSTISHSPSIGSFAASKGLAEQAIKDSQQHGQPACHSVISHHFPSSHSQNTSLTDRKPKRLRLVVTDGTVDLDLQYTD
ncbi:uncharacterized protein [Hoplias malabaricus]|uniref:uncharacterized protein n=1 Tax=Hoplias malabaricus TaxID=27720 RepID=UPI003462F037